MALTFDLLDSAQTYKFSRQSQAGFYLKERAVKRANSPRLADLQSWARSEPLLDTGRKSTSVDH